RDWSSDVCSSDLTTGKDNTKTKNIKKIGGIQMKKWEFKDYTVYEEADVLKFENNDGDIIGYVTKNGTEEVEALDNGADPIADGWEDGIGNTLSLEGWGDEWEKLNIYVIYSDDVKAPADVI